jgi:hypothetical protein
MHSVSIEWHRDVGNSTVLQSVQNCTIGLGYVILAFLLKTSSFPWVRTVSRSNMRSVLLRTALILRGSMNPMEIKS